MSAELTEFLERIDAVGAGEKRALRVLKREIRLDERLTDQEREHALGVVRERIKRKAPSVDRSLRFMDEDVIVYRPGEWQPEPGRDPLEPYPTPVPRRR